MSPAELIQKGGVVVFPTETVYGLGANVWDPNAVSRIFEIKRRPRFNPLIVHVGSQQALYSVAASVPPDALRLTAAFWPGPLTLVLPKKAEVPDIVTAGLPLVGVRMPKHPVAQALLDAAGCPLAAPSANRFSRLSPTRVEHAREQLGDDVDLYLDGGPCEIGIESTIIGWVDGKPTLLRKGGVPTEAIEALIGPLQPAAPGRRPLAPGSLNRHYSPSTPLLFSDKPVVFEKKRRVGLIALQEGTEDLTPYSAVSFLTQNGDLRQAAHQLFSKLQEMERLKLDLIVARPVPEEGLGMAINDRLRRAGLSDR